MATGKLYTVISIGQGIIQDAAFRTVRTTQVKYTVGNDGPFTYLAPPDQQSPEQIAAALTAAAKDIIAIRGL